MIGTIAVAIAEADRTAHTGVKLAADPPVPNASSASGACWRWWPR
jgi:hypothetical protein